MKLNLGLSLNIPHLLHIIETPNTIRIRLRKHRSCSQTQFTNSKKAQIWLQASSTCKQRVSHHSRIWVQITPNNHTPLVQTFWLDHDYKQHAQGYQTPTSRGHTWKNSPLRPAPNDGPRKSPIHQWSNQSWYSLTKLQQWNTTNTHDPNPTQNIYKDRSSWNDAPWNCRAKYHNSRR